MKRAVVLASLLLLSACHEHNGVNLLESPWYEPGACAWFGNQRVEVMSLGHTTYLIAPAKRDWRKPAWGTVVNHAIFEEHAQPTVCPERVLPPWARKTERRR